MMTQINKPQHKYNSHPMYCEFCGKCYKTITNLNKHILLCQVVNRSINKPLTQSVNENLPSQETMYKIIESLTIKYNKLEEKMEELQKWVDKKKKKATSASSDDSSSDVDTASDESSSAASNSKKYNENERTKADSSSESSYIDD
jgi:hypothetical protein